jgi:hypothetical protein
VLVLSHTRTHTPTPTTRRSDGKEAIINTQFSTDGSEIAASSQTGTIMVRGCARFSHH